MFWLFCWYQSIYLCMWIIYQLLKNCKWQYSSTKMTIYLTKIALIPFCLDIHWCSYGYRSYSYVDLPISEWYRIKSIGVHMNVDPIQMLIFQFLHCLTNQQWATEKTNITNITSFQCINVIISNFLKLMSINIFIDVDHISTSKKLQITIFVH